MELIIQNIRNLIVDKQEILLEKLNFGACDATFSKFKSRLNIELPTIFYQFYSIFNGSVSSGAPIWLSMSLLPLSAILNEKILLDKMQKEGKFKNWVSETWWSSGYVPFLSDFSNSLVCIDSEGSFNGRPGQIVHWQNDNPVRTILFESFEFWLEALYMLIEMFDKDLIKEKNTYRLFCQSKIDMIAKSINPDYPKLVTAIRLE